MHAYLHSVRLVLEHSLSINQEILLIYTNKCNIIFLSELDGEVLNL